MNGAMKPITSEASDLPARDIFPREMPRYPNLWFHIETRLAPRGKYLHAVRLLVQTLERRLDLRDSFVEDIQNHNLYHLLARPGEGSDFQARIGPLQHYEDPKDPSRSHSHQVHARFYVSPLVGAGCYRQSTLRFAEQLDFFLIPASVHYEVATEEELHPYADQCPLCGITGEYETSIDRESEDYCVKIHDPLGLELLLHGSIRGEPVAWHGRDRVCSITDIGDEFDCDVQEYEPGEGEPVRLARVYLSLKSR